MDVHTGVKTSSWHQANLNFLTSFFLFFGVSPGVLGDDLNSDATMVKFVFAFSFTRLLYAVPLRININVQIIDEDQCQGNKEGKAEGIDYNWDNEQGYMCFCF